MAHARDGVLCRADWWRRPEHQPDMERPCQVTALVDTRVLCSSALSFLVLSFGGREYAASMVAESAVATVDHSDIRGSEPHNRDTSGAAERQT